MGTRSEDRSEDRRDAAGPAGRGRPDGHDRSTVLFADITGFTSLVEQAGDEAAYEIIAACLRLLDAIVIKHGGRVEKHAGDCVVAVFGGASAITDAPGAAVRAAIEMRRAVPAYIRRRGIARPLEVHSGIDTGTVRSDAVGEATSLVLGDFVNFASKLKDRAPAGEIWVGAETRAATADAFAYRALDPLAIDATQSPIPAYALLDDDSAPGHARSGGALSPPLAGRTTELARLCERLARLARGEGGVAWIRGETGIGKSRLIEEMRASPEGAGVRWIDAGTRAANASIPFSVVVDLFRDWAGIGLDDASEPRAKLQSALERLLGDASAEVLPVVATLMNVRLHAAERRRLVTGDAGSRADSMRVAVARVLRAIGAESPAVLVFEDLDAADAASIDLLLELVRTEPVSPLLFLFSATPDPTTRAAALYDATRSERPETLAIEVPGLAPEEMLRLLDDRIGNGDFPIAIRRRLLAKAAGNPLFVEQALHALRDVGAVVSREGALHATQASDAARIPDTLDALLAARIDGLSSEHRRVLETAAAVGVRFWLPLLFLVLGENDLGDALPVLEEAGLLVAGDEQEWRFRHPRIHAISVARTPDPRRTELERRVVDAVELCETGRRRATALFADVTGLPSLGDPGSDASAYETVAACLRLLDAIIVKHGGHVERHAGDGVVAVFGAPVAIENAPRAAVNAAIEMRRMVGDYGRERGIVRPIELHCGVNTGSVIGDPRKSAGTSDLPVFGDVVNVASRLKDKAPAGAIWVGHETFRATRGEFEYDALAPLTLKGKRNAISVYALLSTQEHVHRARTRSTAIASPMVGRARELALLRERVEALARGESGVVTVVADAGLGKSRLLEELRAAPESDAVAWVEGRSVSSGKSLRFHPFVDLFRRWAGIGADADDTAHAKLEYALGDLLGEESAELFPFIATLANVRLDAAESRRVEAMQGEARERLLQRAVTRVLARLAERRPLVLVFDDLHWADASSIELLCEILRSGTVTPGLFLLLARPQQPETTDRVLECVRESCGERHTAIELSLLGARDVAQLIENFFAGGDVQPSTRAAILAKVAGNPLFAEEVVRALVDEGAVEVRDGKLFATERIAAAVIPGTVEEAIVGRLDRLSPQRRRVLEVAGVIGGTFWVPVLQDVLAKDELDASLHALADAALIVPVTSGAEVSEWSFKYPLIQEVVYGTMLRARREELHRDVAEAIETWLTDRVPGFHAMLAWHYGQGRELERAEEYLFRAGREAVQAAASNEALHFFRQAAEIYLQLHPDGGDPHKLAELEKSVGIAEMNRGNLHEAIEHFDAALSRLGDPVSPSRFGRTVGFAADVATVVWDTYKPWRRKGSIATDAQREQIDIRFRRALSQSTTSPEFVFDSMARLRRVLRLDPRTIPEAAGIYAGAVAIFSYGGVSLSIGRRLLDRTFEIVADGNTEELMLYCWLMRWIHHYLAGDWSDAYDIDERVLAEGLRFGRLMEFQTYLDLECERRIFRGDFDGARARLAEIEDFADRYRHDQARGALQALGAYLHLERRELPEALAAIEMYYRDHGEPSFQIQALGTAAKIRCLAGDLAGAEEAIERAGAVLARAGRQPPFHESRYASARLLVDVARVEANGRADGFARRARRDCRRALRLAAGVAARRPEVWRLAGTLEWLLGRERAAAGWWKKSISEAERLGMHPERERTASEVAQRTGGA